MIDAPALLQAATDLLATLRRRGLRVATAESCTGGLVAAYLTEIAGSSDVVERGFVTYSNGAKTDMLAVAATMIEAHGAVSEAVARAMAEGAIHHSQADIAVAVTGVAGPGGGSAEKPVGLVHFAAARRGGRTLHREQRFGPLSRSQIRLESVAVAFALVRQAAES